MKVSREMTCFILHCFSPDAAAIMFVQWREHFLRSDSYSSWHQTTYTTTLIMIDKYPCFRIITHHQTISLDHFLVRDRKRRWCLHSIRFLCYRLERQIVIWTRKRVFPFIVPAWNRKCSSPFRYLTQLYILHIWLVLNDYYLVMLSHPASIWSIRIPFFSQFLFFPFLLYSLYVVHCVIHQASSSKCHISLFLGFYATSSDPDNLHRRLRSIIVTSLWWNKEVRFFTSISSIPERRVIPL